MIQCIYAGEKVLYDDEPRNMKELLAHPERAEIQKAGDDEIQQFIDQQISEIEQYMCDY